MDPAFRAFTFVDRVTELTPGVSACGSYTVPAELEEFPMSLVAEAVGQLAAWSAMAKLDFRVRPVAGLAGRVTILAPVSPGDTLDLSATIESAEKDAVSYHGSAAVNGREVIRLAQCVGPMLPQEEFDDPAALPARLARLLGEGRAPGGFRGTPAFSGPPTDDGETFSAALSVPENADFFGDHFPRRPVFPGTLLMHENFRLAAALAAARFGGSWTVASVTGVKLRAFIPPGESLTVRAKVLEAEENLATVQVTARNAQRAIGGANVHLTKTNP